MSEGTSSYKYLGCLPCIFLFCSNIFVTNLQSSHVTLRPPDCCVVSGYRKEGYFENVDAFSRNNYVIVGSRTLHCEPPQVYQPTPEPPPKISKYKVFILSFFSGHGTVK